MSVLKNHSSMSCVRYCMSIVCYDTGMLPQQYGTLVAWMVSRMVCQHGDMHVV